MVRNACLYWSWGYCKPWHATDKRTNRIFRNLADENAAKSLKEVAKNFEPEDLRRLEDFLTLLGNEKKKGDSWLEITPSEREAAKRAYQNISPTIDDAVLDARILELRHAYDWLALKQIIPVCPKSHQDNLIRDLYTLLDKKINAKQSIKVCAVSEGHDEIVIENSRLRGAYSCAICLTVFLFAKAWKNLANGKNADKLKQYEAFANSLARLMQKEGGRFEKCGYPLNSRAFYLFSYSMVSFNFETVIMWLLFNAHKAANHSGFYLSTGQELNLWLDFGFNTKSRKVSKKDLDRNPGKFSYSFNETVAFRQNECSVPGSPINRVGKFYFAHGSSNWRECPVCGRMMYYLGDEWGVNSLHLNPPLPVPIFDNDDFNRTECEKEWRTKKLQTDALECVSCGSKTFANSAPMIMQTLIKGPPTSFLEEVQRDIRVSLEKARHIVLFGYQLPPDDALWIQTFSEAVRCRKGSTDAPYCTVIVGHKGPQKWLYGDEMREYAEKHRCEKDAAEYGVCAIDNAVSIFDEKHVRAYCGGIPQVFNQSTEQDVKEILYPDFVEWKGTRLNI